MKPKRERVTCRRQWHRESERRARERGQHMVTARLGDAAYARLRDLCRVHDCTVRDVIEGFLFGTMDSSHMRAIADHGLSVEEAIVFVADSSRAVR